MEQIAQEFMQNLYAAARALGLQAERLWPQLVGITFVKSVTWVVAAVLWMIASVYYWHRFRPALLAWDKTLGSDARGMGVVAVVLLGGMTIFFLMTGFSTILNSLPGVFYPEAQTVLDLLKEVSPKK